MSEIKKQFNRATESKDLKEVLHILSKHPELLSCFIGGITAMHLAADCDFPELIPELVRMGCSPNVLDEEGYPPIYFSCSEGLVSVVDELLKCGADIDGLRKVESSGNIEQTTPLVCAVRNGHLELVQLLIAKGASLNVKDPIPLLERAKSFPEIEEELLRHK